MKKQFETAGDVREVDLLAAFVDLWRRKTTGAISFSRPGASASFGLAGGEAVSVTSSEARFESAAILVRAGKLDAAALEQLAASEGSDGALAALQAGILTKREWRWGEKIRAIEVLTDLLGWPDGRYYFDADARPAAGEFTVAIPRLLLELFLRSRDRNLVEHQLGASDTALVRSPDFEREFATFGLTADAESVVRLIDGQATAQEISRAAPADEFAVRKLLAALTTLGLIRAEGGPRESGPEQGQPAGAGAATGLSHSEPSEADRVPDWPATELPLSATAGEKAGEVPAAGGGDFEPEGREIGAAHAPIDSSIANREESGSRRTTAFDFDPVPPSALEAFSLPGASGASPPAPPMERSRPAAADAGPAAYDPMPAESESDTSPGRSGVGPGTVFGWLLAILVVVVGAVLFFRSGPVSSSRKAAEPTAAAPTRAVPTIAPPEAATAPPVSGGAAPTGLPVRAAPGGPAAATGPGARTATARPSSPLESASAPQSTDGPAEWTARAARDKKRLGAESRTQYSIQLELACEVPTLAEAWKYDRPVGTLWLLTTPHGARECFRVLWGRYPTLEAARRAKRGVPAFFETGSNHPAVVSVR